MSELKHADGAFNREALFTPCIVPELFKMMAVKKKVAAMNVPTRATTRLL